MIKDKRIFITGGAGFLGRNLVKKYYKDNEITIYSRDESKHYFLKKQYPGIKCIIGDIRNYDLLKRSSQNQDIGIFAASLKQISAVDENYEEGVEVIIKGGINSRRAAEENGMESACFISSDKSRAATTLYGSMKFVAGESFIVNSDRTPTKLSCAIYGNVLNSTGSIIPLIWDAIGNQYELTLFSDLMTRFMINIEKAIDLIEAGLESDGYNLIPNLESFLVKDLFEIYSENFGLKWTIGVPRISEKLHEMMVSIEEASRTYYDQKSNSFYMHYEKLASNPIDYEFTSDKVVVSKEKLDTILQQYNYFK